MFGHAATRGRDEERGRRALYEMVVEAEARRRGDYGKHRAMSIIFLVGASGDQLGLAVEYIQHTG